MICPAMLWIHHQEERAFSWIIWPSEAEMWFLISWLTASIFKFCRIGLVLIERSWFNLSVIEKKINYLHYQACNIRFLYLTFCFCPLIKFRRVPFLILDFHSSKDIGKLSISMATSMSRGGLLRRCRHFDCKYKYNV